MRPYGFVLYTIYEGKSRPCIGLDRRPLIWYSGAVVQPVKRRERTHEPKQQTRALHPLLLAHAAQRPREQRAGVPPAAADAVLRARQAHRAVPQAELRREDGGQRVRHGGRRHDLGREPELYARASQLANRRNGARDFLYHQHPIAEREKMKSFFHCLLIQLKYFLSRRKR